MTEATGNLVYDRLAAVVAQEEPGACFALLGDANMAFATRLEEAGVRTIHVRHEHCAVAAATAYARKTGNVGFATVTCGPGVTQVLTALPAAVRAGIPLVLFAGEAPLTSAWYNQAIEQRPLVEATGAAYHSLHVPAQMPVAIRDAFVQAREERRPVVLGVPFDLQNRPWDWGEALPPPSHTVLPATHSQPPYPEAVAAAAEVIADARRIVVLAGLGAVEAVQACRDLAQRLDGMLATTLPARGLFQDDPFSIGIAGGFSSEVAREVLGEADLIVAVGTSLAAHGSDHGKLWPQARVLHVDVAPRFKSQGRVVAEAHLAGDAELAIEALLAAVPERAPDWRSDDLARSIVERPADSAEYAPDPPNLDPRDVIAALDAALPMDWEMVNSSGHCSYFAAQMPNRPFRHFLTIREFGAIGNGVSYAMGVAAARPDVPVVLFDGDGSLMMHVQELETIRRSGLNILIVALNDGAYGSEIHKLRAEGLSDAGAVFGRTDLAAIARGFGIGGETVSDLGAFPAMIDAFAASGGAAVWDVPISDQIISPVIRRAHPPKG